MKILLNAYACEPNKGSEPGVGWKWAITLAKSGNDVHVITRANNRNAIDEYRGKNQIPNSLHFHYYDCSRILLWGKRHHLPTNIYYACWLYGSCSLANKLNSTYHFDIAHHVTFGVYRFLPRLYQLGIPVVLGPLGGGEYTPKNLRSLYSFKERIEEGLRYVINKTSIANPIYHKALNNASLIIAKTDETKNELQKRAWRDKTIVELEIGVDSLPENGHVDRKMNQFLFVGRFIYWKGIKLVLESFCKYCDKYDSTAKLLFIGRGEMESYIHNFAEAHGLNKNIEVISWIDQKLLKEYYQSSCALLFPSLHDSSGNVVLESISNGLPVICLDCGGPASILGNFKATMINIVDKNPEMVSNEILELMHSLSSCSNFYKYVGEKSVDKASEFIWDKKAIMMDEIYNKFLS